MEKAKKPYKNAAVFKGGHPKMWKIPKNGFFKNCTKTICVRKGEKARTFVHTICFGQKHFGPKTV